MDRCKLEYMIKPLELKDKKKMIQLVDPFHDYMFNKDISRFLLNPDTDDAEILFFLGPCHMLYYTAYDNDEEFELLELYRMDKEKELIEIKEKYITQYKLINELCIENNIFPFFKDPTNLKECEKTRLDLIKIIPEEILNKFFGVNGIRDYEPPKYDIDK